MLPKCPLLFLLIEHVLVPLTHRLILGLALHHSDRGGHRPQINGPKRFEVRHGARGKLGI